ncbi:MAG: RNA polymerase sigma factor [Fuerstiella sp.]
MVVMAESFQLEDHIGRVQAGNLDAFAAIVERFERPLRAWLVSRCPPGGDADEVAQKAFVEAFRRIDDYELNTDFRAWLFTIARYQMMAECTRLQRTADYHSRFAPLALSRELERRAAADVTEDTRLTHLQSCTQQLGEDAQRMLKWRYQDELPLAEIASRTRRSVGAIKKHLFQLRQKLHDCIERKLRAEGV